MGRQSSSDAKHVLVVKAGAGAVSEHKQVGAALRHQQLALKRQSRATLIAGQLNILRDHKSRSTNLEDRLNC